MRLYKFIRDEYVIESLSDKCIKVSRHQELNDPFEFKHFQLREKEQRLAWERTLREVWLDKGLICFCSNWNNPLMWAHYCNNHAGVCFGFEVESAIAFPVKYISRRPKVDFRALSTDERLKAIEGFSFMKFAHWSYESEYRVFLSTDECREKDGMHFYPFGNQLMLNELIIGIRSKHTSPALREQVDKEVRIITARPAMRSFKIVTQEDASLQK